MNDEALLLATTQTDYLIQTDRGQQPAVGQRAYIPALPELVFFYEPCQLTEARTGRRFASANDLEELGCTVALLLEKPGAVALRAAIAATPDL